MLLIIILIVFTYFYVYQANSAFDESLLNAENIYTHIEELSSSKYNGSLTGTAGNEKAMEYVQTYFQDIGIAPAGDDNTYTQDFDVMVPNVVGEPTFTVEAYGDTSALDLTMYEDYIVFPTNSFCYEGDLI